MPNGQFGLGNVSNESLCQMAVGAKLTNSANKGML